MGASVDILFRVQDVGQVKAAIGSIGDSLSKLAQTGAQASERATKQRIKSEQDASKQILKSAQTTAKEQEKIARESARIRNAINNLEIREYKKAEADKTRELEKEEAKRVQAKERSARAWQAKAKGIGNAVGGAVSRTVGMAGRIAGTAMALGGGFSIADSLSKGIREEATSGIIFRGAQNKGDFTDQKQVTDIARNTAIATGGTTEDVQGGLDQFVRKTGDLGVAKDMLEDMAKLSSATGTNFADMGNTAAEVFNQLNDSKKTMEVMRALAGQGKAGAIDIKDLGQFGGRLASSAAQYTGSLSSNIESFGAIAQLAKKYGGATDAAEATEAVARISSDAAKHEDAFKAVGVNVYADKNHTKLRNAEDIITESVVKSKGDIGKLHGMFGERSIKAALGAQVAYANAGGGEKGEAAIRANFSEMKANSLSEADVDQGNKEHMAETQSKVNAAMEQLHRAVGERLLPKLPELIEKFTKLIPAIEKFVGFLVDNPLQGIGAVLAAKMSADILQAGIGAAVSKGITSMLSTQAGASIAALTILAVGGVKLIDQAAAGADKANKSVNEELINAGNITSQLKAGRIGPEEAKKELDKLMGLKSAGEEADADNKNGALGVGALASGALHWASGGSAGTSYTAHQEADQAAAQLTKLKEAASDLQAALQKVADSAGGDKGSIADPDHPARGSVQ